MEVETTETETTCQSIDTHIAVDSSDRKKKETSKIEDVQTIQIVTLEPVTTQTGLNCHLSPMNNCHQYTSTLIQFIHSNHTHVDASDKKKEGMPEVEDVQTMQRLAIKPDTSDITSMVTHGQDILMPPSVSFSESCLWNSLYIFIILVSSILVTLPATLFPLHNAMKHPEYWWEIIIPVALGLSAFDTLNNMFELKMIFSFMTLKSFKGYLRLYSINFLTTTITIILCFLIWTVLMGNNHPIPFLGGIIYVVISIVQCIALWFQFPYQLRSEKQVRDRIWTYLLYRLWGRFNGVLLLGLNAMMVKLPLEIQWLMAIILPIERELSVWVMVKLLEKSTDYNTTVPVMPKLTATTLGNVGHAIFVAMMIGSKATDTTAYSILAVDFMINMFILHKIIKLERKISPTDAQERERTMIEKTENIMQLFAIETVEFLAPIVYSVTYAIAYYGPNAEMIGTVKGTFWNFKEIDDMTSFQSNLFLMFVIDFTSAIISAIALWKFCSISFLEEGHKMMKIFFPILSIRFGGIYTQAGYFLNFIVNIFVKFILILGIKS
jgi:hypothetical protein